MTKINKTLLLCLSLLFLLLSLSCSGKPDTEALWKDAMYTEDTTLGQGANKARVEIICLEKKVTLTIQTEQTTLGQALYAHNLVDDPTFFSVCNGIKADWNMHGAYWNFCIDGETLSYGIGDEKAILTDEITYQLIYTES